MSYQWQGASCDEILLYQCISLLLGYERRLIDFVFDAKRPKIRKRAGILREDAHGFSDGEQLLIRAALDFWCGGGHLALWEMLETWDNATWARFTQALSEFQRLELDEARQAAEKPVGVRSC
jgi:hypothetical protein